MRQREENAEVQRALNDGLSVYGPIQVAGYGSVSIAVNTNAMPESALIRRDDFLEFVNENRNNPDMVRFLRSDISHMYRQDSVRDIIAKSIVETQSRPQTFTEEAQRAETQLAGVVETEAPASRATKPSPAAPAPVQLATVEEYDRTAATTPPPAQPAGPRVAPIGTQRASTETPVLPRYEDATSVERSEISGRSPGGTAARAEQSPTQQSDALNMMADALEDGTGIKFGATRQGETFYVAVDPSKLSEDEARLIARRMRNGTITDANGFAVLLRFARGGAVTFSDQENNPLSAADVRDRLQ